MSKMPILTSDYSTQRIWRHDDVINTMFFSKNLKMHMNWIKPTPRWSDKYNLRYRQSKSWLRYFSPIFGHFQSGYFSSLCLYTILHCIPTTFLHGNTIIFEINIPNYLFTHQYPSPIHYVFHLCNSVCKNWELSQMVR